MASPQIYNSNSPPNGKDELIRKAFTKDNDTHTPTPAAFDAFTPALTFAPFCTNELFKQFIKAYLKNENQNLAQLPTAIQIEF